MATINTETEAERDLDQRLHEIVTASDSNGNVPTDQQVTGFYSDWAPVVRGQMESCGLPVGDMSEMFSKLVTAPGTIMYVQAEPSAH